MIGGKRWQFLKEEPVKQEKESAVPTSKLVLLAWSFVQTVEK